MSSPPHVFDALIVAAVLFGGMLLMLEIGRRIGAWRLRRGGAGEVPHTGVVDGAVFALFGLLVAFTFSGAATRFDVRRQLVVQETNAIGTAYLRIDLLPADAQPALRELFRTFLDSRITAYRLASDPPAAFKELAHGVALQGEIWKSAVAACQRSGQAATTSLVISSLNDMIDIVTTRTAALKMHPPLPIFGLLFVLGLGCSLMAGYGMADARKRSWIHMLGFAAVTTITVYVILDIEFPRVGLIRVDAIDDLLVGLRQSMR